MQTAGHRMAKGSWEGRLHVLLQNLKDSHSLDCELQRQCGQVSRDQVGVKKAMECRVLEAVSPRAH